MVAFAAGPPNMSARLRELAGEAEAQHWAGVCAWLPGTGHCRDRDCGTDCVFRAGREAEAAAVRRWRRVRRMFSRGPMR